MEPILANTNLDNQFIFSLFVSNELIVLESVNQMSRLCELSLTECCHQLLKLREFIGLTGTRQRAIQSRIVIDMNKEDIIHESTYCKDHVYRMVIVEGCCTVARSSSFEANCLLVDTKV